MSKFSNENLSIFKASKIAVYCMRACFRCEKKCTRISVRRSKDQKSDNSVKKKKKKKKYIYIYEPHHEKTNKVVPEQFKTIQAVQAQTRLEAEILLQKHAHAIYRDFLSCKK